MLCLGQYWLQMRYEHWKCGINSYFILTLAFELILSFALSVHQKLPDWRDILSSIRRPEVPRECGRV